MASRAGRKQKPHRTEWGATIYGLAHDSDGRWRVVATGHRYREADERRAVAKFYELTGAGSQITLVRDKISSATVRKQLAEMARAIRKESQRVFKNVGASHETLDQMVDEYERLHVEVEESKVAEAAFWARVADEFMRDPKKVARMTGIPALAEIDPHAMPKPSVRISAFIDGYLLSPKLTDSVKKRAKREWEGMVKFTGATTLADLTQEALVNYRKEKEKRLKSPQTRRWLFGLLRTIVASGKLLDHPLDAKQIDDCLSRMACLRVQEPNPAPRPNPITRPALHKLLRAATGDYAMWRAMILVGLNAALSIGEVAALRWDDIGEDGSYFTHRNKTRAKGIPRAAMFWQETMDALKRLPNKNTPFVFISSHGTRWDSLTLANYFRDFRRKVAKIPDADPFLTFQCLRDGAYSAAVHGVKDKFLARLFAGHAAPGYEDRYVVRDPAMVQPACDAVYDVFGPFPLPEEYPPEDGAATGTNLESDVPA
jgi:integrase